MIEDVLEQLVEDYYSSKAGFFTKHNVKFRPLKDDETYDSQMDSVHSDIDVIAVCTSIPNTVNAISCKSWQGGLNIAVFMESIENAIVQQPNKTKGRRDLWCTFRELCIRKWTRSFVEKLREETSQPPNNKMELNYFIVCTLITPGSIKDKAAFENSETIKKHFRDVSDVNFNLRVLTVSQLVQDLIERIKNKATPSVEMSELSRMIQILLAAGCEIKVPSGTNNEGLGLYCQ